MFKYLSPNFAADLVERGSLRVGTLHDFRRVELGDVQGDPQEGMLDATMRVPDGTYPSHRLPGQLSGLFAASAPGSWTFENITVRRPLSVPDVWIYCVSGEYSEDMLNRKEYGACVRITSTQDFFMALGRAMYAAGYKFRLHAVAHCEYMEREYDFENPSPNFPPDPIMVKPERFSYQREVRFWWVPRQHPIAPFNILVPELREFCELVPGPSPSTSNPPS